MILEAARRHDLDLARSIFVGDQPTDMQAAQAAGVGLRVLVDPMGVVADTKTANRVVGRLSEILPIFTGPILTGWSSPNFPGNSC